jgi:hypothetical protein
MYFQVDRLQGNYSGEPIGLQDICLKPLGTPCATQSVLQYFKMDPDLFDEYEGATHAEFCFEVGVFSHPLLVLPVNKSVENVLD